MADEASTIPVVAISDEAQEVLDSTPSTSPSPSPSPKVTEPSDGSDEEQDMDEEQDRQDAAPLPFHQRMDGVRDSFRETYGAFSTSKIGASDAKVELDKAQSVYDGKMTEVWHAGSENLTATRDYIRILQEHESALVAQGQG